VVSTTAGIRSDFVRRYGGAQEQNKFVTITNGYDSADFAGLKQTMNSAQSRAFTVVHAGTLGGERSPREFLQSLGELLAERPDVRADIRFSFVGQNTPFLDGKTIEDYLRDYDLNDVV